MHFIKLLIPKVNAMYLLPGRSSGLTHFIMPSHAKNTVAVVMIKLLSITAAGTASDSHRVPFRCRKTSYNYQIQHKDRVILY